METERTLGHSFLSNLPLWALSSIYLAIIAGGVAWMYWSNVVAVAKMQAQAVRQGTVTEAYPPTFAEVVAGSAAGAGFLWGNGIVHAWLASGGSVALGPIGWAIAAVFVGFAVLAGVMRSREKQEERQRKQLQIAEANVAYFRIRETRKLLTAAGIAVLVVVANFALAILV